MSDEGILTVPRQAALMPAIRIPALTLAMIGGLVAVFAAELAFPVGPRNDLLTPGIRTLVAFGGLQRLLVVNAGEFYRLLSVALVHANALHLFLNCVGLYLAGLVLERLVGRLWLAALAVLGALGGILSPSTTRSGASALPLLTWPADRRAARSRGGSAWPSRAP